MSDDKKDIFESMKDKLEGNDFEFNPDHWDRFEKLMDKQEKEPGIRVFYKAMAVLGVILITGITSISIWLGIGNDKPEKLSQNNVENVNTLKKNNHKENSPGTEKDINHPTSSENQIQNNTEIKEQTAPQTNPGIEQKTELTNTENKPENKNSQEETLPAPQTATNKVKQEKNMAGTSSFDKSSDVTVTKVQPSAPISGKGNNEVSTKGDNDNNRDNITVSNPVVANTQIETNSFSESEESEEPDNAKEDQLPVEKEKSTSEDNPVINNTAIANISNITNGKQGQQDQSSDNNKTSDNSGKDEGDKTTSNQATPESDNISDISSSAASTITLSTKRGAITLPVLRNMELYLDSIPEETYPMAMQNEGDGNEDEKDKQKLPFRLYAFAGTNYYQGYQNTNTSGNKNSLDGIAGMGFNKNLTKKVGVIVSANYFHKTGLNSTKEFQSTFYTFGERNEITRIEQKKLYWVSGELGASYNLSEKLSLVGTFEYARLLTSKSTVSVNIKEAYSTEFKETSSSNKLGYYNGFNNQAMGINVGFNYKVFPKLQLNALYSLGLTDITDNAYFGNTSIDKNSGIRISLQYNLIQQ